MSISIHALRVEGDQLFTVIRGRSRISIHALRVEGDNPFDNIKHTAIGISIHALRVEGDAYSGLTCICIIVFLSTPSGWRATR